MVLDNAMTVCVTVLDNNEATRIRLHLAALFLSISMIGGVCRTCQATKVFVVGGKRFDLLHRRCVGGGKQGDCSGEFMEHRLFVGGGVGQVVDIALEFLVLNGFPS